MSFHDIIFAFITSFLALFPVMNPIGASFIITGHLTGLTEEQRDASVKRILRNCLIIGLGSLMVGQLILLLFGLAVPVIQLGGGFIICRSGLSLLSDSSDVDQAGSDSSDNSLSYARIQKRLFYPVAFPMTVGAGTMSVIFTLMATAAEKDKFWMQLIDYVLIALAIVLILIMLRVLLMSGQKIMKRLGASGTLVINKLVAFLTFCIGIQIMLRGIANIFHITIL